MTQCNHPGPTCTCRKEGLVDTPETAVDVAAIRARCEAATDARNRQAEYPLPVPPTISEYARADASARDVPALLSALEAAVSRAEVAETALARVAGMVNDWDQMAATALDQDNREWLAAASATVRAAVRGDAT